MKKKSLSCTLVVEVTDIVLSSDLDFLKNFCPAPNSHSQLKKIKCYVALS